MVDIKKWLPDFKGALTSFYEENVKPTLETKTAYYENLLKENIAFGQRTQKIAIALGIGVFLLLALAYFWKDEEQIKFMKNFKYIALGILVSYLGLYVYNLVSVRETKKTE